MDTEQKFRIYCSNITKSLDPNYQVDDKTQPLILEGVASTSDVDLEGDYITQQCIESFKLQATNCNIHNNHNVGLDDVIGTVLEVLDSDSRTLKIKFSILPLFRRHIEECIDNGVKLGLSIGGTILDYDSGDDGLKIKNMMLHEISLTPLPANWNTMGTVQHSKKMDVIEAKCLNGVCKQFLKNIHKEDEIITMESEKRYYTKDEEAQFLSEDRVVELINEALNNFATNGVTEERVAEIIDEKLKQFVEQAKALEQAEIEKAQKKEAEQKAEKEEDEEKEDAEETVEEAPVEEETEEEDEEKKEKEVKKSEESKEEKSIDPEELVKIIAEAVISAQKSTEPTIDLHEELSSLKEDIQSEITKAMTTTKEDIEKTLFDGLMKKSEPTPRADDTQLKKFLKAKNDKEERKTNTLNVKDIAKTLAQQQ